MKATFLLEIKRFLSLKNIIIFLLFFILTLYLVYFGTAIYKNFLRETGNFLRYENLKVDQYINYEQYGFQGFRVRLRPSPAIIFCHSSLRCIESDINIKDIVEINCVYKGRKIFTDNGTVGDFSTIFFVLGSLLMLHFGLDTFVGIESIRFHRAKKFIPQTLCSRLIILGGYFSSVIAAAFLFAKVLGVHMSQQDTAVFFKYSLYMMAFITLFYFLGVFIAVVLRFKKVFALSAYLVWFIIIFVIPLIHKMDLEKRAKQIKSNEIVNIKKLNNGLGFEKKTETYFKRLQEKKVKEIKVAARQFVDEYIKKIIPLNRTIENNLTSEVNALISRDENRSVVLPSSFYCFLTKEFSGMGYYGYQDFLKYILELKDDFYRYYFDKRYNQVDQSVESFIKGGENIFPAQSILPANFRKGLALTFLYCFLLLGGTLAGLYLELRQRHHHEQPVRIAVDLDRMEPGKSYFYLSRGKKQTAGIFNYLESKNAVIIEKMASSLYDPGTTLRAWVEFEALQRGVDTDKVIENLEILGVGDNQLGRKIKNLDNEIFNKARLGIELARDSSIYVFDDYLDRASKEFEQTFKEAIDKLKPQAIILYFGSQMFDIKDNEEYHPLYENARFVTIDLNAVTLR